MLSLKVLGISGSPRKGNSEYLLEEALDSAASFKGTCVKKEVYSFRAKTFKPCIACGYCAKNGGSCVQKDDFQELSEKWYEADVIIYSLPVYHMSIPGQVKCFIDRLGNSSFGGNSVKLPDGRNVLMKQYKIIATIAQGIHNFSGQEHTITDMINHALIMQSLPVTGDMWECYIGAGAWTNNLEEKNAIDTLVSRDDFSAKAAIRASKSLGYRAVEMADIVLNGLIATREHHAADPAYSSLYRRIDEKIKVGRNQECTSQ